MTYTPPANFPEFLERHPKHIRGFLLRKFDLRGADLDDAVQDVYLHLMTSPDVSIHPNGGDRVTTYTGTNTNSRGNFLWYINLLVKRYMWNKINSGSRRIVARSSSLEEMTDNDESGINLGCIHEEPHCDARLHAREVVAIAHRFDPWLARAAMAVAKADNVAQAARALGVEESRLRHSLKIVRKLALGQTVRRRAVYGPRRKKVAA
jgi:hypothetical protein